MSASHGSSADFVGNGYLLSSYLNSASYSGNRDTAETTTFGNTSKTYIPGLKDTTMAVEGIYDGAASAVDEILQAALLLDTGLFTYFPYGQGVLGNVAYTLQTIETSYEVNSDVGDVSQISAEFNAGNTGRFARGRVAHPYAVEGAGGQSSSIDGGAASSSGGALVLHATAAATLAIKLQDSADNSSWADIAASTITVSSGRASVRLEVAGTMRRYTRVLWTGTGTFIAVIERY